MLGGPHVWLLHALAWSSYSIWSIFLESTLVETRLAFLGGIYFIILSFGMVKTLIRRYLLGSLF
jgi:hypothetical protein